MATLQQQLHGLDFIGSATHTPYIDFGFRLSASPTLSGLGDDDDNNNEVVTVAFFPFECIIHCVRLREIHEI